MRRAAWCSLGTAGVLLATAAAASPASAAYDPPQLLSASATAQGADPSDRPALSGDGRYVTFATQSRNLLTEADAPGTYRRGGLLRRDLRTDALELVARGTLWADGALVDVDPPLIQGAQQPSISADGRYVVFSTDEALAAQDTNGANDVYLRDMDRPIDAPDAYTLVSARDGEDTPATYDGPAGATVAPRVALSDDGRSVAFVTQAASDLVPAPDPTPAGEVFVRRLDERRTLLVSTLRDPAAGAPTSAPVTAAGRPTQATISGDGSTIAWLTSGPAAAQQAPFVAGDDAAEAEAASVPLVRRLTDPGGGATRVITGKGDAEDPACPPGGALTLSNPLPSPVRGPCDGPLVDGVNASAILVSALDLSRDGRTALLVTNLGPRGVLPNGTVNDLLLVDLHDGVARKAAVRELTREGEAGDPARSLVVADAALSGDGRFAAFTTGRSRFGTGLLRFVGTPSPSAVDDVRELYVADTRAGTVQLVTRALDGGKVGGSSASPDVDDAGDLAFSSLAGTLAPGDGNGQRDVFLARPHVDLAAPAADMLPQRDAPALLLPARVLRVTATVTARGDVRVTTTVPGAGRVALALRPAGAKRSIKATRRPAVAGPARTTLRLSRALRHRTLHGRGLATTLTASFTPKAGGKSLKRTRTLRLRFASKPKTKTKTTKKVTQP